MAEPSFRNGSLYFEVYELSMNDFVVYGIRSVESQFVLQSTIFRLTTEEVDSVLNGFRFHLLLSLLPSLSLRLNY